MGSTIAGNAQLTLKANVTDFKEKLAEAKKATKDAGRSLDDLAETAGRHAKKVIAAQQQMDKALVELTGSATQRQLAALEDRYAKVIAKNKKLGNDTLSLERELAEKRRQIIIQGTSEEVKGSNAGATALKRLGTVNFEVGEKALTMGERLRGVGAVMKETTGQSAAMAGGLGHVAKAFGPVGIAATLGIAIWLKWRDSIRAAQQENLNFLESVRGSQLGLKNQAVDMQVLKEQIDQYQASVAKAENKVQSLSTGLEEQQRVLKALHDTTYTDKLRESEDVKNQENKVRGMQEEYRIASEELKIAKERAEIESKRDYERVIRPLNEANRLSIESLRIDKAKAEVQDKLSRLMGRETPVKQALFTMEEKALAKRQARNAIDEKYIGILQGVTNAEKRRSLEFQRDLEIETAYRRISAEARAKQLAEERQFAFERAKLQENLDRALLDLKAENAGNRLALARQEFEKDVALAQISGGSIRTIAETYLAEQEELRKVSQEKELTDLYAHYKDLILAAIEAGKEDLALEAEIQVRRAQILAKNDAEGKAEKARVEGILKSFGQSTQQVAAKAVQSMGTVTHSFRQTTGSIREMNAETRKALDQFKNVSLVVNDGRGIQLSGANMTALLAANAMRAVEAIGRPGYSPGVAPRINLTVNNTASNKVGVNPSARWRDDGSVDLGVEVGEDVRLGGEAARSYEERYGTQPRGNQRG
jgi:hypothetical protein